MKRVKRVHKRKQRSVTGAAVAGMLMLLLSMMLAVISPQHVKGGMRKTIVATFEQGVQTYMAFEAEHGTLD